MGKKSKREVNEKQATRKPHAASQTADGKSQSQYPTPPYGVSCWICLDDEPDELGQPLVRDCSCRGDSGFAHVSCIVQYSETKCTEDVSKGRVGNLMISRWKNCHCCHQEYKNQLSITMANKMLSYSENFLPENPAPHMHALLGKIAAVGNMENFNEVTPEQLKECDEAGLKLISMVGQMRASCGTSLPRYILRMESNAYLCLGELAGCREEGTAERMKTIGYFEKYLSTSKALGDDYGIRDAETHIHGEQVRLGTQVMSLGILRQSYADKIKEAGEESNMSINAGIRLAIELHASFEVLESENLLTDMAIMSRRVHGKDHQETKDLESNLQTLKVRKVSLLQEAATGGGIKLYQFLGYTDCSKNQCIVKGPLDYPRNECSENTRTVESNQLIITPGTPVVCHGLVKANHLNGKLGEIRKLDFKTKRCEVHFEEKGQKPYLVRMGNLHVVLDVTDKLASFASLSL